MAMQSLEEEILKFPIFGSADKNCDIELLLNFFFIWSLIVPFNSAFNNMAQDMPYRSLRSC